MTPLYVSLMLILACTLIGSFGAVFLKIGSAKIDGTLLSCLNSKLLIGVGLYLLSSVFYAFGIKGAKLSVVYPMVSLANVWALLWARWFFGEALTRGKLLGLALILAGVTLVGMGN